MQLMPKRIKYRKSMRGTIRGNATKGHTVAFGEFGLMSLEACWVSAKELEAGRVASAHFMGREGRLWIRVFPHKPISKKPAEVRMGGGKGEPEWYAAVIRPGQILYELGGVDEPFARQCFNLIAHKLSCRTKLVRRRHGL